MKHRIVAAGREIAKTTVEVLANEHDESTRHMTDEELDAEYYDLQSCFVESLEANPLLPQLKLDFICSVVHEQEEADGFSVLPTLSIPK